MKHLPRSSPHLVHDETLDQYLHNETINTFTSPTRMLTCKRFKMPICTKPTILKLENSSVRNSIFVYTEHAKFQKAI